MMNTLTLRNTNHRLVSGRNNNSISRYFLLCVFALSFYFIPKEAAASHLAGGQITYTHVSGLQYQVTYTFYRDCGGVAAPGTVTIVTSSSSLGASFNTTSGAGVNNGNVVPICPSANTTCSGGATPGREKWVYTANVTLPSTATDWNFSVSLNARNAGITTSNASGQAMYVEATLNNTILPGNNACFFANDPAAFIYTGQTYCYNNGAVDVDGDSLVYSLVDPLIAPATPITWNAGYSASQPIASTPAVTFNSVTGDVCMTPNLIEVTVMAIVVKEYRYGQLVGSVERDIQVMSLNGTDKLPAFDGINSTNTYIDTAVVGCAYTFTTKTSDADGAQNLTITSNVASAIPAASFTSSGGSRPTGTFSWTPVLADATSYPHYFTATVRDNYCNIEGQQVKAFGIRVINLNANFTSTSPTCVGQGVNFYSEWTLSNYSYLWNFGVGSVATYAQATSPNPTGVVYTTSGSKFVTLTITTPGGCVKTKTNVIIINPNPTATFTSTAPQSECSSVDFTNAGTSGAGVTYSWDFGAGASPRTSTLENPTGIIYSGAGTKNVTHIVTNQFGCAFTNTMSITINPSPAPIATFSNTAPQCTGSTVSFTNTGTSGAGVTYFWDFGVGATPSTSTIENPTGVIYSTAGTKTVTHTVTSPLGCASTTNTLSFAINPTPVANFSSTVPGCTGNSVNFLNTGTSGATYSWNFGSGAIPATSAVQNPSAIVYSTSGLKTVQLISTLGSCKDTSTQAININQTPNVSFSSNAPQCAGTGVNLINTGSTGSKWSYAWTFGQEAMPASSTAENPTGIIYQQGGMKVVTFTISDQNCTNTYTTSININNAPVVNAGKDTIICNNVSVQIGSTAVAGNTYSWFPSSTLSNATIANPVSSPIAPTTNYIVTVKNANGCTATDSAVVTMLAPLAANAGVDVAIRRYDSIQIGAALVTGENYSWSSSSGLSSTVSPSPMASPAVTTTYTLSVTGPGCGPVKDEVTVTVHQLPLAKAGPQNDTITVGSSTQLIATGGVQYTWSPFYALDNTGIFNPIANPTITTTYTVAVVDVFGCKNTDTMTVYVIDASFWIPSAFTPDGNGENDVLYVRGSGIDKFEFAIFNRWGEQVFYATDTKQGWNGMKQGTGEQLPEGAYAYFIKGVLTSGTAVDAKGLVNLIR